jgi:hypothetical protein
MNLIEPVVECDTSHVSGVHAPATTCSPQTDGLPDEVKLEMGKRSDFEEVRRILQDVMHSPGARTESVTCCSEKRGRMVAMTLAQRILGVAVFRKYL